MSDLDKARQWANGTTKYPGAYSDDAMATAKIIQSLPDQWVDAAEVREIIAAMDRCLKVKSTRDYHKGFDNALGICRDLLEDLLVLKLQCPGL